MNTVPGYGAAGTFRRALSETLSSRVFFDLSFGPGGMEELQLRVVFYLLTPVTRRRYK